MIKTFRGTTPVVPESTFVSETALVMGSIVLGERCGVWPGAVIRGDFASIRIGDGTIIEDNVVVHTGRDMTIGALVFGVPGKIAGEVKRHQMKRLERGNASYIDMFEQYRKDGI